MSEERLVELSKELPEGRWIFEDLKEGKKETLDREGAIQKLAQIANQIKDWKKSLGYLSQGTVFAFVHDPSNPRAFKFYDTSSLGCSTSLTPPRWILCLEELYLAILKG
ncbi:hypothetical protein SAMN05444391_0449 [Thermocrinis minervae]|uniref:Uncharacterized protein n=2 Tax=Thermocrinis minervae TaxID=381751 RepID=A0A1M6QYR4_9AQUI|nr:hypothetical protein SAMN05444391_0449 [Thermocrinis minervae]